MKVLLTGFAPFGGEEINPSYEAVKLIAENIGEKEVIKREMPCVYGEAIDAIKKAMDEVKPDVVICVGQAGGRFDITP
ncbi:MAG: pyroglutamyl-peptidase I, partial [Clostridiales bacterium]|nr:pyroglutamyl-peptidase I [Clostridiales bacterium]